MAKKRTAKKEHKSSLFDADKFIASVDKALSIYEKDGGYLSRDQIMAIIDTQPRIEERTCKIVANPYPRVDYRCSECSERITTYVNFCPGCGAKVVGIKEGKQTKYRITPPKDM